MARRWTAFGARLAATLFSGVLVSISIYPSWLHERIGLNVDLGPLAWIALVPLLFALRGAGRLACLPLAVAWEFGALGLATVWGGRVSWAGWGAGLVFFIPHHIILILCLWAAVRRGRAGLLIVPALFTCHEFVRARVPIEVPWAYIAHSRRPWWSR
jgi:apolipoprotein N-acyltransferase